MGGEDGWVSGGWGRRRAFRGAAGKRSAPRHAATRFLLRVRARALGRQDEIRAAFGREGGIGRQRGLSSKRVG